MPPNERLRRFLEHERVPHEIVPHREEFTAQKVAQATHVPGHHVAKVVLVREASGRRLMLVLPAPCRLDLAAVARVSGREGLALASEEEIRQVFPDCELGAMPAFGHLYDLPVYADACFSQTGEVTFSAGTHHEVVRMSYRDWERLARPVMGEFCLHARERETGRSVGPAPDQSQRA